jgi:hypothetical protein
MLFHSNAPRFGDPAPIEAALTNADVDSLRILLTRYDRVPGNSAKLLKNAVLSGTIEQLELLLDAGEIPPPFQEGSPLATACFLRKPDFLRTLLARTMTLEPRSDVNFKSAVHYMCESGSVEIVDIVLSYGITLSKVDESKHCGPYFLVDRVDEDTAVQILERLVNSGWDVDQGEPTLLGEYVGAISTEMAIKPIMWLIDHKAKLTGKSSVPTRSIVEMLETRAGFEVIRERFREEIDRCAGLDE